MSKFDRKTQQLKTRVQFVRGTIRKGKGATLSDDETDMMTDQAIADEIVFGTLEPIERKAEGEAGAAEDNDPPAGGEPRDDKAGGK